MSLSFHSALTFLTGIFSRVAWEILPEAMVRISTLASKLTTSRMIRGAGWDRPGKNRFTEMLSLQQTVIRVRPRREPVFRKGLTGVPMQSQRTLVSYDRSRRRAGCCGDVHGSSILAW